MSTHEQDIPEIVSVKEKAKKLNTILVEIWPEVDVKHGHCLEVLSRQIGFKDWNTMSAVLKSRSKDIERRDIHAMASAKSYSVSEDEKYVRMRIDEYIERTVLPYLREQAQKNGLHMEMMPVSIIDEPWELGSNGPRKKMFFRLSPTGGNKDICRIEVRLETDLRSVSIANSEILLDVPRKYHKIAIDIINSDSVDDDMTPRLQRSWYGDEHFIITLDAALLFYSLTDSDKTVESDEGVMEHIQNTYPYHIAGFSRVLSSFTDLSNNWEDKKYLTRFKKELWKYRSGGEPHYKSVPTVFHEATIGGVKLEAFITPSGPYISGPGINGSPLTGSVEYGPATYVYIKDGDRVQEGVREIVLPKGYYVAKYGDHDQLRIFLGDISEETLQKIEAEFGLRRYADFFVSPAFTGLKVWVNKNKAFARSLSKGKRSLSIADWFERATGQKNMPDSIDDLQAEGSLEEFAAREREILEGEKIMKKHEKNQRKSKKK